MSKAIFWHRRDLRIDDNAGLYKALVSGDQVQPIFIFDQNILNILPSNDQRVIFIYKYSEIALAYMKFILNDQVIVSPMVHFIPLIVFF